MNRATGAWLAVALLSISALGVSATTLESTVSTDANDVVDLDYDRVPIGQDTASDVLDEIEGEQSGETAHSADPEARDPVDVTRRRSGESASESAPITSQGAGEPEQRQQQQPDDSASTGPEAPSLLDRLIALLTGLIPALLAVVAVIAAVGLAVRYRDRLLALVGRDEPAAADERSASDPDGALDGSPSHAVERAWLGMVRHLDLERPETMTTSECASAAIEAGLDREAVRSLTETYEEVRYGNRPVTDRREETAVQSQRRLDVGGGV